MFQHCHELRKFLADLVENAFMVGDRLDTDILVAKRAGAHSVLTLTGVNTREEALNAPEDMKPDRIVEYLGELLD